MTEILYALGLGDRIIGVTSYCDYPGEAKSKPKIGGMSNPSLEAIVTLKPDLVVMTKDGNPREVEERLRSLKIRTYVFGSRRLSELPDGIRELSAAVGVVERGELLAKRIEDAVRAESANARKRPPARKVLFIVWPDPLLVAGPGTAIDDAFALLGVENTAAGAKTAYPRYSIEEVIRQAPEVLFVGKASGMDMSVVSQGILKKLSTIPAVRNKAVCYTSDSLYRLGPRVVPGIKELAACVR
jgi:iron complex transport system substrate-binding protein